MTKPPHDVLLILPYPPSVNNYYRGGGKHLKAKVTAYRVNVGAAILEQYGHIEPITGPVALLGTVVPPDRRKRDLDNILKGLFDALEHNNVLLDDNQIADLRLTREPPRPPGQVVVSIITLPKESL